MLVTLKRRAGFSAAHSYYLESLSPEENTRQFGAYASAQDGHGHNYWIEIAVEGLVDDRTGMVINITDIDRVLKTRIISELDGRFLNRELEWFRANAPSTENLVRFAIERLEGEIPEPARLVEVVVAESDTLRASWRRVGEGGGQSAGASDMIYLTRSYDFSASHRLHSEQLSDDENRAIFGKCDNPNGHGHNYEIEVTIAGTPHDRSGMTFPLDELDSVVDEEVLQPMDHKHLNLDVEEFAHVNPTSEMLSVVIWRRLAKRLPLDGDPRLYRVLVRETARNVFEYFGD